MPPLLSTMRAILPVSPSTPAPPNHAPQFASMLTIYEPWGCGGGVRGGGPSAGPGQDRGCPRTAWGAGAPLEEGGGVGLAGDAQVDVWVEGLAGRGASHGFDGVDDGLVGHVAVGGDGYLAVGSEVGRQLLQLRNARGKAGVVATRHRKPLPLLCAPRRDTLTEGRNEKAFVEDNDIEGERRNRRAWTRRDGTWRARRDFGGEG